MSFTSYFIVNLIFHWRQLETTTITFLALPSQPVLSKCKPLSYALVPDNVANTQIVYANCLLATCVFFFFLRDHIFTNWPCGRLNSRKEYREIANHDITLSLLSHSTRHWRSPVQLGWHSHLRIICIFTPCPYRMPFASSQKPYSIPCFAGCV
jgi:hypothetical protein